MRRQSASLQDKGDPLRMQSCSQTASSAAACGRVDLRSCEQGLRCSACNRPPLLKSRMRDTFLHICLCMVSSTTQGAQSSYQLECPGYPMAVRQPRTWSDETAQTTTAICCMMDSGPCRLCKPHA